MIKWKTVFFYLFFLLFNVSCNDITTEVFGGINHYLPAAFGDFNSDKLTDIFVILKEKREYSVNILKSFSTPPLLRPTDLTCTFKQNKVISLVPSDFDGDGAMDILVVTYDAGNGDVSDNKVTYKAYILWGDLDSLECADEDNPLILMNCQPLLFDYNADMISDLYGEDETGERVLWVFSKERKTPEKISVQDHFNITDSLPQLRKSGGHAFIDLNKDLAADLWITTDEHFELWLSSNGYSQLEQILHPINGKKKFSVIGQCSFLDIDLDGDMELVLPVCVDENCVESKIYVYEFSHPEVKWYDININLEDKNEMKWTFSTDSHYLYANTITPRIGDYNLDGYPDILLTLFNYKKQPKVVLFLNSECEGDCVYPRMLVPQWGTFDAWENTVLGTFFDFNENGNLDVLIVNASKDGHHYSTFAYENSLEYDAMFVKVLVLSGQCFHDCPKSNIPYGTNQPGPSVKYVITTATGGIQQSCATQLSQSSHFSLQLPFTVFGLGRNWNFVDSLEVGLPMELEKSVNNTLLASYSGKRTFAQIIPNSQLVVIPYPLNSPLQWLTQLFITPSKAMVMTACVFTGTCLLVATIIAGLHIKEKREDRKERLQEAQRFHFDAM